METGETLLFTSTYPEIGELSESFYVADFMYRLHNDAVSSFFAYAEENQIHGYDDDIKAILIDYMAGYVLNRFYSSDEIMSLLSEKEYLIDIDSIEYVYHDLMDILENEENYLVADQRYKDYLIRSLPVGTNSTERAVYQAMCGIAMGTNMLWSAEWDYAKYPLSSNSYNYNMHELKCADLTGARNGAWTGALTGGKLTWATGPGVVGGVAWGALIGAAFGACIESAWVGLLQKYVEDETTIVHTNLMNSEIIYKVL